MDERNDAPAPVRAAAGERRTYQNVQLIFERHYYDYQLALREAQEAGGRRIAEIQQRFAEAVQRAFREWDEAARDAYDRYLAVARRDPSEGSSDEAAQQAYREYVGVYEAGQETAQKGWRGAQEAFQRGIEEAQYDVTDAWDAAFRDYVGDVRASWAGIGVDQVTPAAIQGIAQTMLAAAASAQSADQVAGRRPSSSASNELSGEGDDR